MSSSYLDKFRSALPTVQGNQILRLLISKRDSGEIKNIDEFKTKLKALTTELLAKRITPTLKLHEAIPGIDTSSAQYNDMIARIQDDLEAAFAEADNLDDIISAHHNLISGVSLKALRFGVNELESKISLYEFLNKSKKGFDDALFNTFRESLNHVTSRADTAASLVYIDPRRRETIPIDEDAEVDFIGERLILGPKSKQYLNIREVQWLSNANSIRSEFDVAFRNSRIANIADGRNQTYWVEPILLKTIRGAGVPMEICLNMSASQDVNFIELEPASSFPMVLTGVDYYDANSNRQSAGANEVILTGPTRINFERITTKCVILKLRQDNYREVQFKKKPGESNFHRAVLGESVNTVDMDSISADLQELLTSDFILTTIMGVTKDTSSPLKYYEYLLGFDNVRVGFNTFDERGIYVSENKKVTQPGQIALRVDEIRPVQENGSASITLETYKYPARSSAEDNKFYHGVVEYWLIIQFYSDDNYLISTDAIPILPLEANRIYHEQIIFSVQETGAVNPNVGQLMFYTEADATDVLVYRNGTLLTYGTSVTNDWQFVSSADPDIGDQTVISAGTSKPMKRAIKMNNTVFPLDIYTVSYTPVLSNTQVIPPTSAVRMKITDLLGDKSARMVAQNTIVFESTRLAQDIAYAQVYFTVIMRRNSAEKNFSPALEEYMVITGSKNTQKFIGE